MKFCSSSSSDNSIDSEGLSKAVEAYIKNYNMVQRNLIFRSTGNADQGIFESFHMMTVIELYYS